MEIVELNYVYVEESSARLVRQRSTRHSCAARTLSLTFEVISRLRMITHAHADLADAEGEQRLQERGGGQRGGEIERQASREEKLVKEAIIVAGSARRHGGRRVRWRGGWRG